MKNLTIITVLIILITGNAFAQNWNAVCVGINNYGDPENNLHWCVKDAIEMKEYLITYKQWSSGKITRLLDNDASESVIHTAIQNMPRSAGNTNLFSFSGHGNSRELDTLYGGSDGDGLYAPDWAMITPSELQADLGSTFNQSTAFLDACGSGIFPRVMTKGVISSACQADELAEEDYSDGSLGLEHGFFSYYLLDGLAKSSITTAEQLHNYAAPLTTALSNSVDPNYPMHPQLGDRFSGLLSIYNSSYTLSGVLPRNQHWSAPSTLQGNVYVPSGVTLTLCADLVLNQNGYTIYSGGGTIIDQRPFGTISSNTTWDENKVLKGNVNVPSGVVLTIVSGVMVNFNGYSLTSTGGTIAIQTGGIITLNPASYIDISGTGSTYEVNGINVGASFNGIGQSIKAISPSGFGVAGWSDGVGGNYREINGNITVNARLKALHKSNTIAAWDNTSQRKLIQTLAGGNPRWLHQVYTSAGHVWLEHSGDGGSTWTFGNNGQPLDGTAGGKCPSIAFTTHYTGSTTDNYIGVVWQEKDGTHYKIKGKIFNQYGDVNSAPSPYYEVTTLFTEPSDAYDAVNANPNLVMYVGYASPYFLTFERKSTSGSLEPGINWLGGYTEDSGHRYLGPFGLPDDQGLLNGTNASTTNVQLSIVPSDLDFCINLVRQAGPTGAIYGQFLYLQPDYSDWFIYQENPVMISYPTANLCPSIVSLPNYYYNACWIEVQNMVFYNAESSVRYYYGTYGTSCSINRGGGGSSSGFAVWSQQPSSGGTKSNKSIRYDNGTPISSSIQTLSTTGKYVQVGNGATSNHSYMYVSSFYPNSVPYYFSTSQTLGPLSKSSSELVEGRGFIIKKGDVYFKYNLEGLNVDGQDIAFIDASDEVDYSKIDNLNNVLLTEPFQLKEDSKVVFMEESGFADSILSSKALGKEGYIHYKVELIDEATGKIVGTIKNVNLNASNVHTTQKPTYSLNTKGLDSKIVRAKITLETNLVDENSGKPTTTAQDLSHIPPAIKEKRLNIKNPNIILTKSYSEENVSLAKAIFEQLELEKPDIPISYSLEQNYPNPFNPATTIHYELPKAGNVTINVYNLLGEEVATLVKGEKQEGRYSVTFDGSLLSSGTYLVRMQSGNYSKTIKILLIK